MAKKTKKNLTKEQEQAAQQLDDLGAKLQLVYGIVASGTNDLRATPYNLNDCITLTDSVGDLATIIGPTQDAIEYYNLIGKISDLLKKQQNSTSSVPTVQTSATSQAPASVVVRPAICTVQPFDGSPARYKQFEQLFEDIIESDGGYSDAEKFVAYKNLVGHHGDQFISSLRPSSDGLQKAKERLKRYYDDPVLVREDATEKIKKLEAVDWASTPSFKLRATSNVLEEAVQSLKDCNTDPNYLGDTVFTLIGSKLPRDVMARYKRGNRSGRDVEELVKLFAEEVELQTEVNDARRQPGAKVLKPTTIQTKPKRVSVNAMTTPATPQTSGPLGPFPTSSSPTTTTSSSSTIINNNTNPRSPTVCLFCGDSHATIFCNQLDASTRRMKASQLGLCFLCLRKGHSVSVCRSKFVCRCGQRHASAICTHQPVPIVQQSSPSPHQQVQAPQQPLQSSFQQQQPNSQQPKPKPNNNNNCPPSAQTSAKTPATTSGNQQPSGVPVVSAMVSSKQKVTKKEPPQTTFYKTVLVEVSGRKVRALLDDAAGRSVISERLADELNLPDCSPASINFTSPLVTGQSQDSQRRVTVAMNSTTSSYNFVVQCNVVAQLTPMTLEAISPSVKAKLASQGYEIADIDSIGQQQYPVELIIGIPECLDLVLSSPKKWQNGLYLIETGFGWTVSGLSGLVESLRRESKYNDQYLNFLFTTDDQLQQQQSLSTNFSDEPTKEEKAYVAKYQQEKLEYRDNRYTAGFPWISGFDLADNYQIAYSRFVRLVKSLKSRGLLDLYEKAIRELIDNFAEVAPPVEPDSAKKVYYLPHHAVYRPDKPTTPVRVVFDGSSHATGENPLNDCMFKGATDWDAVRLLTQFRFGDTAVVSDISKAFLMIDVQEEDRDALRFVWSDKGGRPTTYRLTSVPFGTSASPFILYAVLQAHYDRHSTDYGDVVPVVRGRQYVDDTMLTFFGKSTDELTAFCQRFTELMAKANMKMSKWHSNDLELNRLWASDDATSTKVLGHKWKLPPDTLSLNIGIDERQLPTIMTKRTFASVLASVYDLIGIAAPFVVRLRMEQRHQWSHGYEWDQPFEPEYQQQLVDLLADVRLVNQLTIPRNAVDDPGGTNNLIIFADASLSAYGAVAYCYTSDRSTFLMARAKLAKINPNKTNSDTIVELELKALFTAARLARFLNSIFPFSGTQILSDSLINLKRLAKHPNKSEPALAIRLSNLKSIIDATYHHVSTDNNIADVLSRGCTVTELMANKDWLQGPNINISNKFTQPVVAQLFATIADPLPDCDCKVFHNYGYMVSVYRRLAVYIMTLAKKCGSTHFDNVHEDQVALQMMIRLCQLSHFAEDIDSLKRLKRITNPSSVLRNFPCFIDEDGLVRHRTRLERSINMTYDQRYPFILPRSCVLSRRVVEFNHQRLMHPGVERTHSGVRERYFIINCRNLVRSVIRRCKICVTLRAQPEEPILGPLPSFRLNDREPAFTNVGIDLFGPIKANTTTKGKKYGLIVVCTTTRAVHIELMHDLSADQVYSALRNFMARRGVPSLIYSDNGSQLLKLRKQMTTMLKELRELNPSLELRFVWPLQTAHSPWRGGFYERRIRDIKESLESLTFGRPVTPDELRLALTEIEARMNSRPLFTYNGEFITPAHFFTGRSLTVLPHIGSTTGAQVTRGDLVDNYIKTQRHVNAVWQAWQIKHLEQLRSLHQNPPKGGPTYDYKEGDVVILVNKSTPRHTWPLGIITRLHPSPDGVPRTMDVRTTDRGHLVVKARDIRTIIPLDQNSGGAIIEP